MPKIVSYTINAAKVRGHVNVGPAFAGIGYQIGSVDDAGEFTLLSDDPAAPRDADRPRSVTVPLPSGDMPTTPDDLMASVRQALKDAIAQKEGLDLAAGDQILGL